MGDRQAVKIGQAVKTGQCKEQECCSRGIGHGRQERMSQACASAASLWMLPATP
jgi:hypothetical protein